MDLNGRPPFRHSRESGNPDVFDTPGFRLAPRFREGWPERQWARVLSSFPLEPALDSDRGRESRSTMTKQPAVYILSSKRNGTLYIGVTSNLQKRTWEHKNNLVEGFTKKYGVHRLVYYELHEDMVSAIKREKQMKKWNRGWKLELIERQNPSWRDLWEGII